VPIGPDVADPDLEDTDISGPVPMNIGVSGRRDSWPNNPVNHTLIPCPGDSTFLAVSAGNLTHTDNKIQNQI